MESEASGGNLRLLEETSHQHLLAEGSSYMEGSDFMFVTECGEFDISFAHVMFRVGGGKDGVWQVDDTAMLQTTVVVGPKGERGVVRDNDFISNRNFPTEWTGDATVETVGDTVVWKYGAVTHTCSPPQWHFKGLHNGVDFDLKARAIGKPVYWKGEWAQLSKKGAAGFGQPIEVDGTIRIGEAVYEVKQAIGCRDVFIHTTDLAKVYHQNRLSYYWVWILHPSLRAMVYHIPGVRTHSEVNAHGTDVSFADGTTTIEPLEWWLDPRTGVQVPIRWELTMTASEGSTNAIMTAGPRAIYGYLTKSGLSIHTGFLARATGTFTAADGTSVAFENAQSYVEWGRSIFPWAAAPDGACPRRAGGQGCRVTEFSSVLS